LRLSLRWRIAAAYALLLALVLAATYGVIVWRLQAILFQEARARINTTMHQIVQAAQPSNPFEVENLSDESLLQLFNSSNLAAWESPTTFVQVDTTSGYPIARTPNLGGSRIPPNTTLTPKHNHAFRTVEIRQRPFLVEDRLLRSGGVSAVVHVAEPLDELNRTFAQTRRTIVFILGGAVLAVIGLSVLLASQVIGPITELSRAMREIGSERLNLRLGGSRRHDEVGELTANFNDLLERLQKAFARERQFISDASHELKTPLTSINANAQLLLRWGDRDEKIRRESLETIARESSMLAEMVNGMLTLAKADRGDEIPKEPLSLAQTAFEAVRNATARAHEKGLALRFASHTSSSVVGGDANLLRQLVANLIDNAIKFTPSGEVSVEVDGDEDSAWVEVRDTGPGIPQDELPHVFERFYRADKARSRDVPGTGLGLAIVRSIASVHGGSVSAGTAPGGGALIRAAFPRIAPSLTERS
jgi:signal transduction histidine kinase